MFEENGLDMEQNFKDRMQMVKDFPEMFPDYTTADVMDDIRTTAQFLHNSMDIDDAELARRIEWTKTATPAVEADAERFYVYREYDGMQDQIHVYSTKQDESFSTLVAVCDSREEADELKADCESDDHGCANPWDREGMTMKDFF